jgi:predicted nucleic acid-binding protein
MTWHEDRKSRKVMKIEQKNSPETFMFPVVIECVPLLPQDFTRIAELNAQYADLPGDFADLSLIAISERLDISAIATLDSDFDIYRRYRQQPFERIFTPE